MESIYHDVVVVSVLSGASHTERIKGKLSGSLGDYLVNVRGDEEIRSFFEKHNLSISNNPTDEKSQFARLAEHLLPERASPLILSRTVQLSMRMVLAGPMPRHGDVARIQPVGRDHHG